MKKALSVLLAMLVLFSMVGAMGAAAVDETGLVTIYFYNDENDAEPYVIKALPGVNFVDRLQQGENVLVTPTKESTETTKYTFKYWEKCTKDADGNFVYTGVTTSTGNVPAADEDTYYVAVFAEEEIKESQSLWAFIRTIFERINMIFEYFAEVFRGVIDFES